MSPRQHFARFSVFGVVMRLVRRIGARLSRGFLVSMAGIVAFGLLADEMGEGDTASFDSWVRGGVNSFADPMLTKAMIAFSFIGDWPFLTLLGLAIFGFLLYIKWKREAVIFMITNGGELMLNMGLKAVYQRARPEPLFEYTVPSSYSFPSGHALGSFCFFSILAWIVVRNIENTGTRSLIWVGTAFLILAIGLSRIYLGVHYPSDVVAGYLVAAVWTLTVIFADRSLLKRGGKN